MSELEYNDLLKSKKWSSKPPSLKDWSNGLDKNGSFNGYYYMAYKIDIGLKNRPEYMTMVEVVQITGEMKLGSRPLSFKKLWASYRGGSLDLSDKKKTKGILWQPVLDPKV